MPDNKPVNLSAFSSFVTVPESANTLKNKKFKSVTLVCLQANPKRTPEQNARVIALKERADSVRKELKKRGLKFNLSAMALDGIEQILAKIEAELL